MSASVFHFLRALSHSSGSPVIHRDQCKWHTRARPPSWHLKVWFLGEQHDLSFLCLWEVRHPTNHKHQGAASLFKSHTFFHHFIFPKRGSLKLQLKVEVVLLLCRYLFKLSITNYVSVLAPTHTSLKNFHFRYQKLTEAPSFSNKVVCWIGMDTVKLPSPRNGTEAFQEAGGIQS